MKTGMRLETVLLAAGLAIYGAAHSGGDVPGDPLYDAMNGGFVHPGDPVPHANDPLIVPSFDHLIPTTYPTIQAGTPEVHPTDSGLVHPTEQPLVTSGAQ